jgi:hypothetical protein
MCDPFEGRIDKTHNCTCVLRISRRPLRFAIVELRGKSPRSSCLDFQDHFSRHGHTQRKTRYSAWRFQVRPW